MTKKRTFKMCWAGLTALALTLSAAPVRAAKTTYQDVDEGAWYAASVAFCQQHELMEGASSGSFEPDGLLTRGTLAEALYRLAGSPAPEGEEEAPFTDVGAEHPNVAAIRWAKASGVVSGYEDGSFGPEDPITREQIAALLWNDRGREEPGASAPYTDRAEVSDWAAGAVEWAYGVRLMQGTPEGAFLPQSNTSRAQGAAVIMNYAQMYYGLRPGYQLPAPSPVAANGYRGEAYALDDRGYLSYSAGPFTRGVDVSAHQKEVDWRRVAATGMDFAMVRAGYRGYTSGGIVKDAWFDANMRGALANGLQVGVYFFSQAITTAEAMEEALFVLQALNGQSLDYPLVYDWETISASGARTKGLSNTVLTDCAITFCTAVAQSGYIPMIYYNRPVGYQHYQLDRLTAYDVWFAQYADKPSMYYNYRIWQYSDSGSVPGVKGKVDMNIAFVPY